MKKIIMAMLAFALAGSAFAATKTESIRLGDATSIHWVKFGGGNWGGKDIMLGNDYFTTSSYTVENVFEMDISAFDFTSIDSVEIKQSGSFFTLSYALQLDENLGAIKISFYEGGTGDARADWIGSSLTLVKEISGLSIKEITDGITIDALDFADSNFLTFVISIDDSLIPRMPTAGEGIGATCGTSQFQLSLTGTTAAVPEPAEWAAIFGAIALGAAVYRRRK